MSRAPTLRDVRLLSSSSPETAKMVRLWCRSGRWRAALALIEGRNAFNRPTTPPRQMAMLPPVAARLRCDQLRERVGVAGENLLHGISARILVPSPR
jgi:hypothetical protein